MMNKFYPVQIWLTSIFLLAPLLIISIGFLQNTAVYASIPLFIPFGLLLSIPTLIVSYMAFWVLILNVDSSVYIKLWINILAITGIWVTCWLIAGAEHRMLSIVYTVSVMLSSFIYRIREKESF